MKDVTRRDFIKGGVVGLAAGAVLTSVSGCDMFLNMHANKLKFIHLTDSHLDLNKKDTVENFEAFVTYVNKNIKGVDFVLFGGDNFNNNVPGTKDAEKFKKIADKLKMPWYAVRGNKESSPSPANDPLNQKDFAEMFFPKNLEIHGRDWKLKKDNYTILGIDTTITGHGNGVFTKESLDFVENELKSNPNQTYIILNHQVYHNFWNETDKKALHKYVLNNIEEVKKRLFRYKNLKMTLSGHKHLQNVKKIDGVDVVSTVGFVVPQKTQKDHRFTIVEFSGDKVLKTEQVSII